MSIEIGILRPGSTSTFVAEHRVDFGEEEFSRLASLVQMIQERTGIEVDMYGQATFEANQVHTVLECIKFAAAQAQDGASATLLRRLEAVAQEASNRRVPLTYMGL